VPINNRPNHWFHEEYIRPPERLDDNICNVPWYEFAGQFVAGKNVLDVGCGVGGGVKILKKYAKEVYGFDVQPQVRHLVDICLPSTEFLASKKFDVVVSVEAIQGIVDDIGFVKELVRLAKEMIIVITPNWEEQRCENVFNYREYTYVEWKVLFEDFKYKQFYGGNTKKIKRLPISANNHKHPHQGVVVWVNE